MTPTRRRSIPSLLNACGMLSSAARAMVFYNSERRKPEPRFLLFFLTGESSVQAM
jgi:hypothetical protein